MVTCKQVMIILFFLPIPDQYDKFIYEFCGQKIVLWYYEKVLLKWNNCMMTNDQ